MKHPEPIRPLFGVCINNAEYPASLERHKIYQVLPDEEAARDGDIRVIDESGEDYLYPASFFVLIEVPQEVERATKAGADRLDGDALPGQQLWYWDPIDTLTPQDAPSKPFCEAS